MLAVIISGEVDWADVFFLIAVICAFLSAVVAAVRCTVEAALVPVALGFTALALLVL